MIHNFPHIPTGISISQLKPTLQPHAITVCDFWRSVDQDIEHNSHPTFRHPTPIILFSYTDHRLLNGLLPVSSVFYLSFQFLIFHLLISVCT